MVVGGEIREREGGGGEIREEKGRRERERKGWWGGKGGKGEQEGKIKGGQNYSVGSTLQVY